MVRFFIVAKVSLHNYKITFFIIIILSLVVGNNGVEIRIQEKKKKEKKYK